MNRLTRKLEAFGPLPDADRLLLDEVIRPAQAVGLRMDLIREGETPHHVNLILEGFACRYKILPTGRRQIMAYLVPGDFCDLHVFILKAMDHTIATLSPCTMVKISRSRILELLERPAIARAFWWAALVDEATLREWLVNIGARKAEERVAHLLCELLLRLETVGLTTGTQYALPLTQAELADTVGLTGVHVNRILQRLRRDGLITLKSKRLVILDEERLKAFGGFNPNYLHLAEQNGLPHQSL